VITTSESDFDREEIAQAIKQDLYQFESYSNAIAQLHELCSKITNEDIEKMPSDVQEWKQKQKEISGRIIEESTVLKGLINQKKQNDRKIEKIYKNITVLNARLLDIDERLKKKDKIAESTKACTETGPKLRTALSTQYKLVMDKLLHARKHYPAIYAEVEQETGIHFFTPLV